jgi:hypothetical protein
MDSYLLITELERPAEAQAKLEAFSPDIATAQVVLPDSVRLELRPGSDLSDEATLDRVVRSIMRAIKNCGENKAQMGFFTE